MTDLTTAEIRALEETLDDEYRAWATYDQVIADFGEVRPFTNIREAEARHIGALHMLFARYGLAVPENPWPGKVERYASLHAACEAGVAAEIANGEMYGRLRTQPSGPTSSGCSGIRSVGTAPSASVPAAQPAPVIRVNQLERWPRTALTRRMRSCAPLGDAGERSHPVTWPGLGPATYAGGSPNISAITNARAQTGLELLGASRTQPARRGVRRRGPCGRPLGTPRAVAASILGSNDRGGRSRAQARHAESTSRLPRRAAVPPPGTRHRRRRAILCFVEDAAPSSR
jgi:hypothetical protein